MTTEQLNQFAAALKKARDRAGLTELAAAAKAGIAPGHWSEYEAGRGNPTYRTICLLAMALGVKASELMG